MKLRRTHTTPTRSLRVVAGLLVAALALTACSGSEDDAASDPGASETTEPTTQPTTEPAETSGATESAEPTQAPTSEAPAGPTLAVSIAGDQVDPNAEEISLGVGETLVITFDTDRGGELHVHSKPEQYVEFDAGTSEQTIVVETPGEVEVEEHDTGAVVAVLEVS